MAGGHDRRLTTLSSGEDGAVAGLPHIPIQHGRPEGTAHECSRVPRVEACSRRRFMIDENSV